MRNTETITGQVRALRVVRDGWGIAQVAIGSDDRATPVVGTVLGFDVGDTVEAKGAWSQHPSFGRQFKATSIRTTIPSDADGWIGWVARKLPGIGRKRAADVVSHFGGVEAAHHALLDGARLLEVNGITAARARDIAEAYRAIQGEREKMQAFVAFGLTDGQIARVEAAFGDRALEVLRADPYVLSEHVAGFGFKRSDAVALAMGMPRTHPSRITAALVYVLEEAEGAGHTFVPSGRLVAEAARVLEVDGSDVAPHLRAVTDGRRAVDRAGWIFRPKTDAAEDAVARAVMAKVGRKAA